MELFPESLDIERDLRCRLSKMEGVLHDFDSHPLVLVSN